ncbi:MAG: acyl-CoA synthetase [Betaproteobacteria bacterium]|nr:acyl-CoA synthetase [Betaproteobacteria bacterium]
MPWRRRPKDRRYGVVYLERREDCVNPFERDLDKNPANYAPLTPLSFLERSAYVYPDRVSVIHGASRYTWRQTYERARRLGSALARRGIGPGHTVAAMLPNIPAMYEAHFGVAMCGAVLNTVNTRLDADAIAFMLEHGEARVLLTDLEFSGTIEKALQKLKSKPVVIDVVDPEYPGGKRLGERTYEELLAEGDAAFAWRWPQDEWEAISLNYTSGTTGNPKGVVYHHRGAYLNGLGNIVAWGMPHHSVYLWTLPMFHCNGWCFPWTMAANAGVNVCLRRVEPELIFSLMKQNRVTHYCGAPIVHQMLINAPAALRKGIDWTVNCLVAGAAPPAAVIEGMQQIGFNITHVYGLTETYGPATVCAKSPDWATLPLADQVRLNGRQGVRYHVEEGLTVMDPETMQPVPADGETMGEIMFRGNITMKGYLKNPKASQEAFRGGWFHSGDLAVMQPDGYVKIKDRSKDIIISGGENISSIEVEDILYRHPAVMAAAVVAMPDDKWGETPCAFVELKKDSEVSEREIIDFCRQHMARFKAPRAVVFGELPKTSTGKIQKFMLREKAKSTSAIDT